jgi:hypothetical protein
MRVNPHMGNLLLTCSCTHVTLPSHKLLAMVTKKTQRLGLTCESIDDFVFNVKVGGRFRAQAQTRPSENNEKLSRIIRTPGFAQGPWVIIYEVIVFFSFK